MLMTKLRALFAEEIRPEDRRRDPRQRVLLSAAVHPIELSSEAKIHNASATGLMAETDLKVEVGQTLHLSLDGSNFRSGTVRWIRGRRFGLAFGDLLEQLAGAIPVEEGAAEGQTTRAKRIELGVAARLIIGSAPRSAIVKNVSRSGMLLENIPGLEAEEQLLVELSNRAPVLAVVQWSDGGRAGLKTAGRLGTLRLIYSAD